MNYIRRLEKDQRAVELRLREINQALVDLQVYVSTPKFTGPDADYIHIRTDLFPRLMAIRAIVTAPLGEEVAA